MTEEKDLIVGAFYWVWIVFDPDTAAARTDGEYDMSKDWENNPMPARFAGRKQDGTLLWNYLGMEEESDWPVRWIGEEIKPPKL